MRTLAAALVVMLGITVLGPYAAAAQDTGAFVVRTPGDTCAVETAPGVFQEFTCDNIDVYTPNGKIRSHARGVTTPPADGTADVTHESPTFSVCSSTVSASGRVRLTCHLDF